MSHFDSRFGYWIDESIVPPKEGQWALVLCDAELENMGPAFRKMVGQRRFTMRSAVCVGFDREGFAQWISSLDGSRSLGWHYQVYHVTHYQLMPEMLPEDAPLPKWVLEQQPWRAEDYPLADGLACARRCAALVPQCHRYRECLGENQEPCEQNMFGRQF